MGTGSSKHNLRSLSLSSHPHRLCSVYSSGKLTANLNSGTAFEKCDYVDTTSSTFTEVTSSSTGTSSPSPSASGPASDSDSSSLSTGATAGIAVAAVVVGLAAIVGLVLFLLRRRKMKKANGPKGPIDGDWEHPSQEAFNPYIMADTSVGMASLGKLFLLNIMQLILRLPFCSSYTSWWGRT